MMNYAPEFLFEPWAEAFGWMLLHSVWQGLVILGVILICLRFIPTQHATVRYAIGLVGLPVFLGGCIITWFVIYTPNDYLLVMQGITAFQSVTIPDEATPGKLQTAWVTDIKQNIQGTIPLAIQVWVIGAVFFSLRIGAGWWYINRLSREAVAIHGAWSEKIKSLAAGMGITRIIGLAESQAIHIPVVIGYLKPIILIPVGMLSGLTTEQVETIFVHELTHIRRHDYLVNVVQSFIEAMFFFNPFVWMLSSVIRREREHCCDDAVLTHCGNALVYAQALSQLEEARFMGTTLAPSLAQNKNELLNRIKRIMEKSVKQYPGKERIVPALLLVIGLICASMLSVNVGRKGDSMNEFQAVADTVRKKEKPAKQSRKNVEEVREPIEPAPVVEPETVEESIPSVDENEFMFDFHTSFEYVMPPVPSFESYDFYMVPPSFPFHLQLELDTFPLKRWGHSQDWREFSEQFEKRFSEEFSDFYKSHQEDIKKMMKELEEQFQHFPKEVWASEWQEQARQASELAREQMEKVKYLTQHEKLKQENLMLKIEEQMKDEILKQENLMLKIEEQMKEQQSHMRRMEEKMKIMEENMKAFQEELKEELIKDGYLGKDEKIRTMNWDENGDIEINGQKIKDKDKQKYNKLNQKYFKEKDKGFKYKYME